MRGPTSPTAISICCCSPRSIVRCSGSVRSRGGISPGWPNWPKSSATQAALEVVEDRLSYAEILLDLVQHVRRAPAGIEMARACTVRSRVERILAATTAPAKLGWGKRIGTAAVILPVVIVSAGSIAYRTAPVSSPAQDALGRCLRRPCASRSPSPSIHWAARRSSPSPGKATSCSARSAGSESSVWPRRAMAPIPTRRRPARSLVAVGHERQPAGPVLSQNGRDISAIRVAELSSQSVEADAGPLDSYCRLLQSGTWPRAHHHP